MANYNQVSIGSGDKETVLTLQKELNKYGAGLQEDGIFGAKTDAALRNYQSENGLQADGIAGEKTWAKLMDSNQQATQQTTTPTVAAEPEKVYRYEKENDPVYQAAKQKVTDLEGTAPTLQGSYDEQYKRLYEEVMGQKPFEYDLNGDPLWQQYKDQHNAQGKLAQLHAQGQAAALTGGYGSSYAQRVGQQAYQGELQKLNDRVPELYQLAMQKYNNDLALKKDKLSTVAAMREDEYGRYMDEKNDYYTRLGLAREDEQIAHDRGSSEWYTGEQLRRDDENTAYTRQESNYSKLANLIASSGYMPSQDELKAAGMSVSQANALKAAYEQSVAESSAVNVKYSTPSVDSVEYEAFLNAYETRGEEAAMSFAEAYNIAPAIVVEWLEMARLNVYGDNYYDPGA